MRHEDWYVTVPVCVEETFDSYQYPQWTGRRDKRGIPVYVFEIAGLNSKRMSAYQSSLSSKAAQHPSKGNISPNLRRLFALYENLIQFVLPLCSAIPNRPYSDTPVSQSNNIVDISKTGLKQFWNLKGHVRPMPASCPTI